MGIRIKKKVSLLVILTFVFCILPINFLSIQADEEENTVTIESLGLSITPPNGWTTTLKDSDSPMAATMRQNKMALHSISEDELYTMELYVNGGTIDKSFYDGVINLTNANQEQVNKFVEGVEHFFGTLPSVFKILTGPTCQLVTINDVLYVRGDLSYSYGTTKCVYDFYFTVKYGECIELHCYYVTEDEVDMSEVYAVFDGIVETAVWENGVFFPDSYGKSTEKEEDKTVWEKINDLNIPLWIIWILLLGVLLWKVKPAKMKEWHEDALSLVNTKGFLGFFSILIILHHIVQFIGVENSASLGVLENMGVCFVGAFFFFSGYGLFYSYKNKEDYLRGFLRKRLPAILVPFYVCIIIFMLNFIALGGKFGGLETLKVISGFGLINSQMWYVVEIALFYILFYLVFRFIKNENIALTVLGALVVIVMAFSFLSGHGQNWFQGEWWYNTSILFIIGMIYAKHKEKIVYFSKKLYWVLLPVCALLTVILYRATVYMLTTYSYWSETPDNPAYLDKLLCLSCQLPMVIFFVFTLLLITMKIKFKNPILSFLGKISLEIYLIHNLFVSNLGKAYLVYWNSEFIFILLVVLLSVLFAWILHDFNQYIISLVSGKIKVTQLKEKEAGKIHSIDCFRVIAAFLVVCIHIPFKGTMGAIVISFGKVAVPFFLVASGYFLYRDDNSELMNRLKKQVKKIFLLTIFANLLYLAIVFIFDAIKGRAFMFADWYLNKDKIVAFLIFNMSPFGDHLWYLGSLLYALLILMALVKFKAHKYVMFFSPALLGIYIYLSFSGSAPMYEYRNALIVTLPYIMMGCLIRRYEKALLKVNGLIYILISLILSVATVLEYNHFKSTLYPFFSVEILVYVVFLILLKYPNLGAGTKMERAGNSYSLFIYIAHVIPILYIGYFIRPISSYIYFFGPVIAFALTYGAAVIYMKVKGLVMRKIRAN